MERRNFLYSVGSVSNRVSNSLNWVLEDRNLSLLTRDGWNRLSLWDSKRWTRLRRNFAPTEWVRLCSAVPLCCLRWTVQLHELLSYVGSEAPYSFRLLSQQQDSTSTPETDSSQGDTLLKWNSFLNPLCLLLSRYSDWFTDWTTEESGFNSRKYKRFPVHHSSVLGLT